ncbi:MAG: hypothetical protein R3208_07820 [Ketobacteraceae bacterium]|nr:hypothetical protein [Ketobacteraceae bacterium]
MNRLSRIIDFKQLRRSHQIAYILVDLIMVGLIIVNLLWIIFDTMFTSKMVQEGLMWLAPEFTHFYREQVHPDFVAYDMIFVSIFVTELLIRWAIAIYQKTYHRWFFYPFIHWYDVLGCIPVGSFRWLRLLRVISILYRLQKYDIIDLSNTYPVRFFRKYFNVLVEEISDRVVVNVLNGVQDEVRTGNPVAGKILSEVLLPQKHIIIEWLTGKVNDITETVYPPRRAQLQAYVDTVISESISRDAKVAAIERLPVIGEQLADIIETTVADVVFSVMDRLVTDIGHEDTDILVKEMADIVLERLMEPSDELNEAARSVLLDVMEVIKDEVKVQRWKLNEQPV